MGKKTRDEGSNSAASVSPAWQPFAEKLSAILAMLAADQCLVLAVKRTRRFIQFAAQGSSGLRAETTGNPCLAKSERLDAAQFAALKAAGWQAVSSRLTESTAENDAPGSSNFFAEFPPPVSFTAVAELAVHTLAGILHVPHPGFLEYEAFDTTGESLLLSALGLQRAMPAAEPATALPSLLLTTLCEVTGIADLAFDEDGDIGIRYGSVLAFIRLAGNPPYVHLHCRLLAEVEETPDLLARLNEINAKVSHLHFFLHEQSIYAVADVPAAPFVSDHVTYALDYFCQITDGMDTLLQTEFGGRTAFYETLPSSLRH
ncbi:MAG: YbjN domain-containing protein [Candidatus Accumulibacter sp. UW26]|jgi:hypothetical protein